MRTHFLEAGKPYDHPTCPMLEVMNNRFMPVYLCLAVHNRYNNQTEEVNLDKDQVQELIANLQEYVDEVG